jgi:ABC-2 type transport system ATP-binding protein
VKGAGPAIECDAVSRRFGERLALDRLTLTVERGEILGLLGPNGSGKTTTVRILATLLQPHGGAARILSWDVARQPIEVRRSIGVMPERPSLYDRQTVEANVRFWAEAHELPDPGTAVARALAFAGVADRQADLVGSLSKGLKQRVALARAIVHRPPVLLLDEPSSGLDPSAAAAMESLVRDLAREGTAILLNTHRLAEAERLCDRVAILREGRLVQVGTPRQVRAALLGHIVEVELAGVVDAPVRRAIESFPALREVWWSASAVRCRLLDAERDTPDLVARLVSAGARIVAVRPAGDLERAYLELMNQPLPGSLAA